jgi:hypothetical protein
MIVTMPVPLVALRPDARGVQLLLFEGIYCAYCKFNLQM